MYDISDCLGLPRRDPLSWHVICTVYDESLIPLFGSHWLRSHL
jgi:hypothetical protein